ncbi:MAG: hypothetical protein K8F91_17665, partial [Candidatus Obscuribacterales bacterium]|nr:hypothetical protein [Candidatus Obscuribacterales bacterium]
VQSAAQTLTHQGGNLTRQMDEMLTASEKANLPKGLLDNMSETASRLGRSTDDMATLRQLDDAIKLMEGKVSSRTLQQMRTTLAEVEQSAINLDRARRLQGATQTTIAHADEVSAAITRYVETARPTGVIKDSLVKAADDLKINPQSSSVTRMEQLLKVVDDPALSSAVRPGLTALDRSIAETTTLGRLTSQTARAEASLTRIAESTSSAATKNLINGIKSDLDELSRTTATEQIIKRIDNQLGALPESVANNVKAIVDETLDMARLEKSVVANLQTSKQLGTLTSELAPATAQEAGNLARIEAIAAQISTGGNNANLLASLERSLASLSPQNQAALQGLVARLRAGLSEKTSLVDAVVNHQLVNIPKSMPQVGRVSHLSERLDDLAEVGQRLDVARYLGGGETAILEQYRLGHAVADLTSKAEPVMLSLGPRALGKLAQKGDLAAFDQLLLDGLTSDGWKLKTLASGGSSNRLLAFAADKYQAAKYLASLQDPALTARFAGNVALGAGAFGATTTYLGSKVWELLDRYSEPGTEAHKLLEHFPGLNDAKKAEQERSSFNFSPIGQEMIRAAYRAPIGGFVDRFGAMSYAPDARIMEQDLQDTGKIRRYSQIGYAVAEAMVAPLPITVAHTIKFTPMSPDNTQGDRVKLAVQQFSMRKVRDLNAQAKLLTSVEGRQRKDGLSTGSGNTATASLSSTLRSVSTAQGMRLSTSVYDLIGRENTEARGLDRTRVSSGGGPSSSSIAAYSSPGGLTFAKVDPDQGKTPSSTDEEKEIFEALLDEANQESGNQVVV